MKYKFTREGLAFFGVFYAYKFFLRRWGFIEELDYHCVAQPHHSFIHGSFHIIQPYSKVIVFFSVTTSFIYEDIPPIMTVRCANIDEFHAIFLTQLIVFSPPFTPISSTLSKRFWIRWPKTQIEIFSLQILALLLLIVIEAPLIKSIS